MDKLVLCTTNEGKLRELRALLPPRIKLLSLADVGVFTALPETGPTLSANALEKASFVRERCHLPCLADDSGLEVTALGGAPGVHSARYAGPDQDAERNMLKLLQALNGVDDRSACFRTVLAFVTHAPARTFEGVVCGRIGMSIKGDDGFGYDPVFIPEGGQRTFAEMRFEEKNAMSHRAQALALFVDHLATLGALPDR